MIRPALRPAAARSWQQMSPEERRAALAAALLPFAQTGSLPLIEAAGACLLRRFRAAQRPPPHPLAVGARSRLYDFCRRAARRILEGRSDDPFPGAVIMKPVAARAPRDHRLAGILAGWAFYGPKSGRDLVAGRGADA